MSKFSQCAKLVREAAPHLSLEGSVKLSEDLHKAYLRAKRLNQEGSFDDIAKEFIERHAVSNRQRANSAFQQKLVSDRIAQTFESGAIIHGKDLDDYVRTYGFGNVTGKTGSRDSLAGHVVSRIKRSIADVTSKFKAFGISEIINDSKILASGLEKDMYKEMFNFGQVAGYKAVNTGNKVAKAFASTVFESTEHLRNLANKLGANIKQLPGYIIRNNHDADKLRRTTFEAWRDDVYNWLDPVATFQDIDHPEQFLKQAYQNLRDGIHHFSHKAHADLDVIKPTGLAKRISNNRLLHWKDGEAAYNYAMKYGHGEGGLITAVYSGLENLSRSVALMERLGPNPQATLNKAMTRVLNNDKIRNSPKNRKAIESGKLDPAKDRNLPSTILKVIEGADTIPVGNGTFAKLSSGLRITTNMLSLGFTTLRSFPDVALIINEAKAHGISRLDAFTNSLRTITRLNKAEREAIAEGIEVSVMSATADMMARMGSLESGHGFMAHLQRMYFKANFLEFWTRSQRQGMQVMLSNHLARNSSKDFRALHPKLQERLGTYNIDGEDWNVIRKALTDFNKKKFVNIENIESEAIRLKLQNYFVDSTDFAILTPGAKERVTMFGGFQPGDPEGELRRFFWHFKSFPLTIWNRPVSRLWQQGDYAGLGELIMSMTLMGYASQAMIDTLKGKTIRPLDDPGAWVEAMVKGGSLGLYGDAFFGMVGDQLRYRDLFSILGPEAGKFGDITTLLSKAVQGDADAEDALRFIMRNTPNLFYMKGALDNLIWRPAIDSVSPGASRKEEQRLKKRTGQEFIFK